ncbi:MAG: hypothetical protein Q9157_006599 [Trypethelium eluteriae]
MEILAHIGAPSGRKDDDRYEAQARAYAGFQSVNLITLNNPLDDSFLPTNISALHAPPEPTQEATQQQSPDFIEDTQLAVAVLQKDLLTSSLQELLGDDPDTVTQDEHAEFEGDGVHQSHHSKVSYSGQSGLSSPQRYPDNERRPHNNETNVCNHQTPYMAIREGNNLGVAFIGVSDGTKKDHRESSKGRIEQTSVCCSPQSEQDHESLPSNLISQYIAENDSHAPELYDKGHIFSRKPLSQVEVNMAENREVAPEEAQSLGETEEQQQQLQQDSSTTSDSKIESKAGPDDEQAIRPTSRIQSARQSEQAPIDFRVQPYNIFVENTPTGTSRGIPSQFTEEATTLKHLGTLSSLATAYQPVEQVRELGPYERAKWTVNTSAWSAKVQLEFWQWLQDHGKDGRLGWNITFFREHDKYANENTIRDELGTVTVFCWPEVIKHIYLALFVASQGRIAGTGATLTTGAKGKLIVRMR